MRQSVSDPLALPLEREDSGWQGSGGAGKNRGSTVFFGAERSREDPFVRSALRFEASGNSQCRLRAMGQARASVNYLNAVLVGKNMHFHLPKKVKDFARLDHILLILLEEGFGFLVDRMRLNHRVSLKHRLKS